MQLRFPRVRLTLNMADHKGLEVKSPSKLQEVLMKWIKIEAAHRLTMLTQIQSNQIHMEIRELLAHRKKASKE